MADGTDSDLKKLAANTFRETWRLLDLAHRRPDQDEEMVRLAQLSRDQWGVVGLPTQWARGEWQLSRVYAALGQADASIKHAKQCLEISVRNGLREFEIAAAHEALVRAYRVAGLYDEARHEFAASLVVAGRVVEPEDRAVLLSDLREHAAALDIPWEEH